ncbi:MAG: hypothetical protein OIF40_09910 [Mangrovicoccus sp.]|nr:hypothetical protein [Mangrovicoccus sp.]
MSDLEEARSKANAIILKALGDEDFRTRLKNEPMATMKDEGVEEKLAEELGMELKVDGEPIITACIALSCSFLSSVTLA